jgi:hypothetical protein
MLTHCDRFVQFFKRTASTFLLSMQLPMPDSESS